MASIMEGTHTILLLYSPIRELSNISLYFTKRRASGFKYKSRTSHSASPGNDHDPGKKMFASSKQRGQSSDSTGKIPSTQPSTKEAVEELCWLAAEHHQLLADLLSLSENKASTSKLLQAERIPRTTAVNPASDSSVTGSGVDPRSKPIWPMEESLQVVHDSWDLMEDNQTFDPVVDFCTDFSECEGELGYESSSCSLMEGLNRQQSESNLRPIRRFASQVESLAGKGSTVKSVQQLYGEINQRGMGVRVVAKVQEVEGKVLCVSHANTDGTGRCPETSRCKQENGEWRGPNGNHVLGGSKDNATRKLSEGLQLPLPQLAEPSAAVRSHKKSPSSPSLAGIFNTSYPASNSLQSMSPALSPLSSKQVSPQLNHRIVLLSDKDDEPNRGSSSNTDEPKLYSEVIDKNGNKRTVTHLDLDLSRRPSNSKWNSTSDSTTTEDSLLRQDDIWVLDEPQEVLSHVPRPDHLDFLRITPPEDDIIGDTPYYPKLERTTEVTSPSDSEDRTPGRLQAVWPPPKPKDEEEKVGLKYTEAEHQAAVLQLKRECKEEQEKMQSDLQLKVFQLRGEHAATVKQLEDVIAKLQRDKLRSTGQDPVQFCDVAVSTTDDLTPKTSRTVAIQTDRETFIKSPDGDSTGLIQSPNQNLPKKLNLDSIEQNLKAETGPAPRKPVVEPACPMKPLYWNRIQIQDNNNNTLWGSLKEPDIVNTNEFEDLFSKAVLQQKKKPLSDTYEKKAKTKKIIKLLDGKRSQAVGILISSLHLEMKDIQQAVLNVDNSVVDLETIEALYENRATGDEMDKITKHYETSKEDEVKLLDKPEQFLYELSQIPDFAGRAHCIIFQSVFRDTISSIHRKVQIISSTCKALLECKALQDVIGLVLAFGNYMNGGNRTRGQADGFGLEILPKLKDVKSKDNRINLVDYVVLYHLRYFDQHAGTDKSVFPLPEPQDFFQAAQVKFDDLTKDVRKLKKDLTACEKDVQKVCTNSSEEHLQPFKQKMEAFVSEAQKEHSDEEDRLNAAQKSFQDVVNYFGLKPKSGEKEVAPSHVFLLWYEFCNDFRNSWVRQSKNISKERLKEAQENIKKITAEKRVETKKINAHSLKERLRQKEANVSSS
uniref:Formin 1 n=1 Tax=Nothobranchius kadleci TaxID=1051664 RepID=A0A1A8DP79_NOTKA